jgi:ribonuclease P protein subunit RPR2
MVKKQKEETPNINATPNRDIIQRLNFLYQASVYLQSLEPPASIPTSRKISDSKHTQDVDGKKKRKHKRKQTTGDLARSYVQCMRVVGQKTTVKM